MTQPAPFEVPAGERREPSAAERFARVGRAGTAEPEPPYDPELEEPRLVSLKAVTDVAGFVLIVAGLSVGVVAAWIAGGRVPGLATLAGALLVLGFLLNG